MCYRIALEDCYVYVNSIGRRTVGVKHTKRPSRFPGIETMPRQIV